MSKKISALNAACQMLLRKVLSSLQFLLNVAGKKEKFSSINAIYATTDGIMLIS